MFSSTETLPGGDPRLRVLAMETLPEHVLVRLRATETDEKDAASALVRAPAAMHDEAGRSLTFVQASSFGSGPFAGMVDIAFESDSEFEFDGPIHLELAGTRVTFRRSPAGTR